MGKRKWIISYLLIILMILSEYCFSQTRQFQHITSKNGISQSEVYCFLEDTFGYMWFGTVDGLNRYDGYSVRIFNAEASNPNSITNNTIRCLVEDRLGRIWVGTDDGLSVYDCKKEQVYQVDLSKFIDGVLTINALHIGNGHLYLGTTIGLIILDLNSSDLLEIANSAKIFNLSESIDDRVIISFENKADRNIWILTSSKLFELDYSNSPESPKVINFPELNNQVSDFRNMVKDWDGNLWITSHDNGFIRFNLESRKSRHFKNEETKNISNKVSDVAIDSTGNLWIGTHDQGLIFLDRKKINDIEPAFELIQNNPLNERSINSNLIYSLYVSENNLIWIGTIASGINIYNPNRKQFNFYNIESFNSLQSNSTNFVRAVYADKTGDIWIGLHNNGLYILNQYRNSLIKSGFGTESVFHINSFSNTEAVICTGSGIGLTRKLNSEIEILDFVSCGPVFYVCKGRENVIWVAGLNGVMRCRIENEKILIEDTYTTTSSPKLSLNNCRVLYLEEDSNRLFIGTEGGGLNMFILNDEGRPINNRVFKNQNEKYSISNNYIRSIIMDDSSSLWIGTYEGLNKMSYNRSLESFTFKTFHVEDGLPNNTIQSIVQDNEKNIWVGTNGGLSKLNPQTNEFVQYTVNDGIQSNEFSEHTAYKKPDNEIIIGGINGINTFYPDRIKPSKLSSNTTITDFYLFNKRVSVSDSTSSSHLSPLKKSISLTDTLFLRPNQNNFGFEFSAMNHSAPEKIRYAYMLEGFDKEWNFTDTKNRRSNYTNLKFGEYVFKVKSTNSDGIWDEKPKEIAIFIKTPYYRTFWAYLIYTILGILIIIFFTNYTAIRSTTKKKILLENQHNKKLRELEEFRNRFFVNISHDLRTPLTLISNPLDTVINNDHLEEKDKSFLQIARKNVNRLMEMIEELLEARKIETTKPSPILEDLDIVSFIKKEASLFEHSLKNKGLNLNIQTEKDELKVLFDSSMLSKVFSNILSNALKYSEQGDINVTIFTKSSESLKRKENQKYDKYVEISVQDFGKGIKETEVNLIFDRFYQVKGHSTKGYGIGLSHSKELVEAHEGTIEVESTEGKGTIFRIVIPVKRPEHPIERLEEPLNSNGNEAFEKDYLVTEEIYSSSTHTKRYKLLIVEDNIDLRNYLYLELGKEYNVLSAMNGVEGFEIADNEQPDIIVSDVMMPAMDGIEFCEKIKTNIKTSHIPVILLTAKVNKETKYKGLEIGADDYISKPFDMKLLLIRIKNLLDTREKLRTRFKINQKLEPSKVTLNSLDEDFLTNLMKEIEKGITDSQFSITELERTMGMSHSSFYNKVQSLTGLSAKELLFNSRMKRAKQILIDSSNIRVSEIAFTVGFSDPKYFSKCFKEYFGKSPSKFLKEFR